MKGKHKRTLVAVFSNPISGNIQWRSIEALFKTLDAEIEYGAGSRVHVSLNGVQATFHRPHPRPDTDKGAVVAVRKFFERAGVVPGDFYDHDAT